MTMSPEDAAVSDAVKILDARALIVLVYSADGITRANYYFNPADAAAAVLDATNDNESAQVLPAQGITESDLFRPQFTVPLGRPGAMVHIENEQATACGLEWKPGDMWVPVPHPRHQDVCALCLSDHHADPEVSVPLTPSELYDVFTGAVERATWRDRMPRRPVLKLRQRTVAIGGRRWRAATVHGDETDTGYGYTLRQVRQMRRALVAAMRARAADTAQAVRVQADELGL